MYLKNHTAGFLFLLALFSLTGCATTKPVQSEQQAESTAAEPQETAQPKREVQQAPQQEPEPVSLVSLTYKTPAQKISASGKAAEDALPEPEPPAPAEKETPLAVAPVFPETSAAVSAAYQLVAPIPPFRDDLQVVSDHISDPAKERNLHRPVDPPVIELKNQPEVISSGKDEKTVSEKGKTLTGNSENGIIGKTDQNPLPQTRGEKEPVWEKKSIYAVPDDMFLVSMDGTGWIFLGERDGKQGVSFRSRNNSQNNTDFVFETAEKGTYHLRFQQQDLSSGENKWQEIEVSVISQDRYADVLAGIQADHSENAKSAGTAIADKYYDDGRYAEALSEYKKNYQPDSEQVNDRIGDLSYKLGDYQNALSFWKKNLDKKDDFSHRAVRGIIEAAISQDDADVFETYLPKLLEINDIPVDNALLDAAKYQLKHKNLQSAAVILQHFLDLYYYHGKTDWVYYTLGTIYEQKGSLRDVHKAKYYYNAVMNDFPASLYWEKAAERVQYINRYFLNIQ